MAPGVFLRWCSLVAAVTSGCRALAPEDQRGGPRGRPFRQDCELPDSAPGGVVLEARRTVVPGGESVTEQGQATDASGSCVAGVPDCTRVSTDTLLATYDKIRKLAARGFLSRNERVSPHYGWRSFSVKWSAGRCEFVDGVTDPLAEADKKRFYEAYDAIVALVVGARGVDTEVLPRAAMAKCRNELDAAIESYNTAEKPAAPLQMKQTESPSYGYHGEPPYVTFTVAGGGNSFQLVWYKDRDGGSSDWASSGELHFVGRHRRGATVMLWGADVGWQPFFAAFKPSADACLAAFAER